jgi:hypothetical protein
VVDVDSIDWKNPGHKQRRYNLNISSDAKFFKKSTDRLHKTLETELTCLQYAKELNLKKIQQLVVGEIDRDGMSYIITKYCGRNITRSRVPPDWKEQLNQIDIELKLLIDNYKVYHNDVQARNCFIDNHQQLTVIDFDLATIGSPNRRASKRHGFLNCDFIRSKIQERWGIK